MLDEWFWFYACQKGEHLCELTLPILCMIFIGHCSTVLSRVRDKKKQIKQEISKVLARQGLGERKGMTGIMV